MRGFYLVHNYFFNVTFWELYKRSLALERSAPFEIKAHYSSLNDQISGRYHQLLQEESRSWIQLRQTSRNQDPYHWNYLVKPKER